SGLECRYARRDILDQRRHQGRRPAAYAQHRRGPDDADRHHRHDHELGRVVVNALRSNRTAAIAAIVAADLLVLVLGWFTTFGPQRAQAKQLSQSTAATESQISEASKPIAPAVPAAQEKQPDIRTADLYSLAKAMPTDEDTPDLLLELNLLARESGVTLKSIS